MRNSQTLPLSNESQALPWIRTDWYNLAVITLGTVIAIWAFWQPGYSETMI